ncbi:MAG: GDSL-type esterase/lipase family protein, partial [Pseudomonadota bacterium]|nr:GDSL-type esterase/lipase family protein [Pseudomonadota bacterium]
QWVNSKKIGVLNSAQLHTAQNEMRKGFNQALKLAGVKNIGRFDPATYPIQSDDKLTEVFTLIHQNRNYDNNTGETGHTTLTDISFRPIVGLMSNGAYETFDLVRAQKEFEQIKNAKQRIFIVGDSTSAVYEQLRFPRMGWGQTLEAQFKPDSGVKVITGSRSGRSSRDFYNGRWFAQMEPMIQAGDYVFINHGHNDQNCDANKPIRGAADVNNLCTYPNNAEGQPQFPTDQETISFQYSLERYIKIARARGAIPVLFTPTTRIKNAHGQQATPVVHSHFTKQNTNNGYLFTGDYTQTIKDAATANAVPLIDLEAASIQFVNGLSAEDWKNYWLVVDPIINSFYANGVAGSTQTPDGTHFQEKGAEMISTLIAQGIKQNPELLDLGKHLK